MYCLHGNIWLKYLRLFTTTFFSCDKMFCQTKLIFFHALSASLSTISCISYFSNILILLDIQINRKVVISGIVNILIKHLISVNIHLIFKILLWDVCKKDSFCIVQSLSLMYLSLSRIKTVLHSEFRCFTWLGYIILLH